MINLTGFITNYYDTQLCLSTTTFTPHSTVHHLNTTLGHSHNKSEKKKNVLCSNDAAGGEAYSY
ncbi:hypothetical protein E2C01_021930 [Portunus trituberculatus]|uniref:Uncharacterized protein n=1 Tax=Portunus trituberculatus TaxID=210409 RepID=A0A5B7E3X2_PORTR|nr:hypothetical protein [Portunus trituberculatus]